MIPANYLSPEQATTILNTLLRGLGTGTNSSGTAGDLGLNGYNVIPSLRGLPEDLVNRVITTDMSGSTTVFSTSGLATASITMLNEIRNRVVEAVSALYDDQGTPIQSPFYGLTVGSSAYNHIRDAIIHTVFRFDSRYLLRKRSDVGTGAEAPEYELASRYQLMNHPLILARLKPHGIPSGTIDDIGTNGAYQITTTTPHGMYNGMTLTPMTSGATIAQEILGLDRIEQNNPTSNLIGDVTSKFVLDTGSVNHYISGQAVVTDGAVNAESGEAWTIMNWQPNRYIKRLSDTEFELYRDAALTNKIVPGWGSITGVHTGTYNGTDTVAVNTNGTHLMFEDVPVIFDPELDSNTSLGIFERKDELSVDPLTGVWTTNGAAGFSFVDGQITNFNDMNSAGWQNIHSYSEPLYFKRLTDTTFELYRDEALTTKFYPGQEFGIVSSFTQAGSDWSVNFSVNPPIVEGQSIRFSDTNTNFSNALGISTFTPIAYTTPDMNYTGVVYSAGQFIAYGATTTDTDTTNYYYSTDGLNWTLGNFSVAKRIVSVAYNATNNRTVAVQLNNHYVETRTGIGSWSEVTHNGANLSKKIVTFDLSGTPRFLIAPSITNNNWTYSQTGVAGTWNAYAPFSVNYDVKDITVGGTSGSDLVVVAWTGTALATSKSTSGGQTWSTWTTIATGTSGESSIVYVNGKYVIVNGATAYYSTNGTSWTSVTLPATKTWHNLRNLNGVLYANATDGSTSSIKSTDGGVTWTTITLTHGGVEYSEYANGVYVGIKNPTTTPVFLHSENALDWANYNDSTWTLSANHQLENGQPIRFNDGSDSTFVIDGYTITVPRGLWAKTTGLAANEFKLFLNEGLTIPWTPWYGATNSAKTLTSIVYRMAFYAKRTTATTFALYVDSAMTNPYSQTVSLTGFTAGGNVYRTGHTGSISPPSTGYIQPMFWTRTESYNSVTLWANAARTVPYPFFSTSGVLATGASGTSITLSEVESGLDLTYVSYTTTGLYRINNIGYEMHLSDGTYALTGALKPVYYAKKISDTVVELFVDAAMSNSVRSGGTPNAPAIGSAVAGGNWQITFFDTYRYRLDTIDCYNIGGERYFYTDYNDGGATKVNATWTGRDKQFFTDHITSNKIQTAPGITVVEYANSNAGAYYGMMRKTKASGADTPTGPATVSPSVYGGVGSPVIYDLNNPGQFQYDSQFVFGIQTVSNVGTAPAADPLDYTGSQWDTDSNLDGINDRAWPTHVEPSAVTWTIEQPNQTFESHNLNRYGRARDVTQYRFRLSYSPMTKDQFRPFLATIHAARGSFKPFKFTPPKNFQGNSVTIDIYHRDLTVPAVVRVRDTILGGQQVITLDGLPPNLSAAYSAGHAVGIEANGLGGWGVATHDVKTNAYGEANIRINNPIPVTSNFGDAVFSDAPPLDCYLDGNSVEIKVDTLGYHYLEVDLVTKRIF